MVAGSNWFTRWACLSQNASLLGHFQITVYYSILTASLVPNWLAQQHFALRQVSDSDSGFNSCKRFAVGEKQQLVDGECCVLHSCLLIVKSSFCVTGITGLYDFLQLDVCMHGGSVMWWFCHVVSLFWGIQFPFHARSFKEANHGKYIHIPMVIVGLGLPTLPVIVPFTAGEPSMRGFRMITFLQILCGSLQRDLTFYSLVLPLNLIVVSGIPLVIMMLWAIVQANHHAGPNILFLLYF